MGSERVFSPEILSPPPPGAAVLPADVAVGVFPVGLHPHIFEYGALVAL